jgi:rhodanese-related sulfurtransferase
MRFIDVKALSQLMSSRALYAVFDIRERGEYNARQIPFTSSLPRSQIEFRIGELVPVPTISLVVYDEGGERAALAARTLAELGYSDVAVLDGGLAAWEREGLPLSSGVNVPSKAFGEKVQEEDAVPDVSPEELKQWLDAGANVVIFDVRTPEEYGRFCIPGGLNVPGGDLVLWAHELKRQPQTRYVVNCAGRTRSIIGTAALKRLGLDNVVELRNGTMGWVLAGFQLEAKPGRGAAPAPAESRARAQELALEIARRENIVWASFEQVRAIIQGTAAGYVTDVRSEAEYAAGHIPGSINVPGGQAVQRADDFMAVRNGKIIFVSQQSARAVMAAYWYGRMGFPDVAVLREGIAGWAESGNELERGPAQGEPLGFAAARDRLKLLAAKESRALLNDASARILDVGASSDYKDAHLPRAIWISRGWLELKLPAMVPDRSAALLISCRDGRQSVFAASALTAIGYGNVSVLEGGTDAWRAAGYETESGLLSCWSEPNDVVLSPSVTGDKAAMRRYLDWEVQLTR